MAEDQTETRRKPLVLGILAAVLALFLATVVVLRPTSASDLASVEALEPTVRLGPSADQLHEVEDREPVDEGDFLETDRTGMAQVDYFDGSLVRVGPGSEYRFETLEEGDGQAVVGGLDIGRTFHRVSELSGSQRYEVRTANAVASVRGTEFLVICEIRNVCEIGVISGSVEVISRVTGQRVLLGPGQEITVFADGTLSEVRPLDLTDAWLLLNLRIDGIDVDDLRVRLFGPDEEPGTDDDPTPPTVLGETAARTGSGSGTGGGGAGGGSGTGGSGSGGGSGGPGGGGGSGGGGGTGGGGSGGSPGATTSTTGRDTTTTSRPGNTTTTTRPGATTSTTRPGSTTTTRPPRTTSTTGRPDGCTTGYPPRPC